MEQRPILFYGWEPSWIFSSLDLERLEEPSLSIDSEIWIAYAADLEQRLPEVAQVLHRVELNTELVNAWVLLNNLTLPSNALEISFSATSQAPFQLL